MSNHQITRGEIILPLLGRGTKKNFTHKEIARQFIEILPIDPLDFNVQNCSAINILCCAFKRKFRKSKYSKKIFKVKEEYWLKVTLSEAETSG